MVEMPQFAVYALAELFDPRSASNQYAKRIFPPRDQIPMVDGSRQLKAAIEYQAAGAVLMGECSRLVAIYNKRHKDELERWNLDELEAFAERSDDKDALRAFASHRKARPSFGGERRLQPGRSACSQAAVRGAPGAP